ncbi:hypothetical protein ZHAS_00005916 [Anopheles sinensis]|uniref:Uncharacterized protein n=1 Tax=Anopheles sinensis TaxID=74873 RepID=A0A084VKL5_ANOSI|nr:hypothetical protein ZHAS_00005916 [Anopheles sinensis]
MALNETGTSGFLDHPPPNLRPTPRGKGKGGPAQDPEETLRPEKWLHHAETKGIPMLMSGSRASAKEKPRENQKY